MTTNAERCRKHYHKRKTQGICQRCQNPHGQQSVFCEPCRLQRVKTTFRNIKK